MTLYKQRPIIFDNSCDCIVDYDLLEKSIIWMSDGPSTSIRKIFLHGRYPAVSINKTKMHVHRLIKSYSMGRRLGTHEHVHHKNHNRLDSSVCNLELINASEHLSRHNSGKKLSLEHRMKIAEAGRRRVGIKLKKRCEIDLMELKRLLADGCSINYAAKHFSCDWSTIKSRIEEHPELLEAE